MKASRLRLELGPRDIDIGVLVGALRHTHVKVTINRSDILEQIAVLLHNIQTEMYQRAHEHLSTHILPVHNIEELLKAVETGYAKAMWCEQQACEEKVKELSAATSRVLPFDQRPHDEVCSICGKPAKKVVYFAKAY